MKTIYLALYVALALNINKAIGSESGMPQLNPEFWAAQTFWLSLIFIFLYMMVWKIFLPKITNNIENRKMKVLNDINEAQKLKDNAEKKFQEYKKIIEDARKEAKKIILENKKKLDKNIKDKKQKFDEEIEKEIKNVEKEIISLKETSKSSVNKIAVEISSEIVMQITGAKVNTSNVSAIVDDVAKRKIENYL